MYKKLGGLILGIAIAVAATAQYDAKAKEILQKVSSKYESLSAYSVQFENKLHSPLAGIDETTAGNATISGDKFRIDLESNLVIVDGKSMWTFMKEDNEVNISEFDRDESEVNPTNIYNMWKEGYKYRMTDTEAINGVKHHTIELNPEDKNNQIFKVVIWVNPSNYTIKKWVMFEKSGNRYSYEIKKFNSKPTINANTFKFDKAKYPGVHVEDLR